MVPTRVAESSSDMAIDVTSLPTMKVCLWVQDFPRFDVTQLLPRFQVAVTRLFLRFDAKDL